MESLNYKISNATVSADKNAEPMFKCDTYPCFIDFELSAPAAVFEVKPVFPEKENAEYEIYFSTDCVNFSKFTQGEKAKYIRLFIKYYSGKHPTVISAEIFGEPCEEKFETAKFSEPDLYIGSGFDKEITDEDVISDVRGIISRTIGEKYVGCFEFVLNKNSSEESFIVESSGDKIRLTAVNGIGLACAFNCYLREACKCHVSRFGNQLKLPEALPTVKKKIHRKTTFKHRYAYNYCTHSYSMAFWGEEEWQREIDYLAMSGVNLVLDITGMEEVYRRFLTKLGYSHNEIKNFIAGPAYFAWFYMANICTTGGPIHDGFFEDRCTLARKNHRRMRTLGMNVVLQGYMGMAPSDIAERYSGAKAIPQGLWNGIERPVTVRPDSEAYKKLAALFYESQREVFGDITHYYAGDLCHEGGTMGGANVKRAFNTVIESMLGADSEAIWVMQAWGGNPTDKFTRAIKKYRGRILMLDLYGEIKPKSTGYFSKLRKYNYLFGLLNSFGGRNGIYGNLDTLADMIKASSKKKNFRGIALTAESNSVNPIMLDLFFSTVWEDISDIKEWIAGYCERRYGGRSESIIQAVMKLSQTALSESAVKACGEGAPECVICTRPGLELSKASCWGGAKIGYSESGFDEAVRLFLAEYDKFSGNECYIFDAVDLLSQALANRINTTLREMFSAYKAKNPKKFSALANDFSSLAEDFNRTLLCDKRHSITEYLQCADKYSAALDDFTRRLYMINIRALITTWYSRPASDGDGYLHDYSNRQLGGFVESFYKMRWEKFIKKAKSEFIGEKSEDIDWFKLEWDWVLTENEEKPLLRGDLKEIAQRTLK